MLGNYEISENVRNFIELSPSAQSPPRNKNPPNTSKKQKSHEKQKYNLNSTET